MSDVSTVEPKSLGVPTVNQWTAVYRSMLEPSVRSFHAKMVTTGYDISLSGAQRFIATHIKKPPPKPHQAVASSPLMAEELSEIQQVLAELTLDVAALKARFECEVLIYNIMLLRFSRLSADRLAMAPKDASAMVKSMTEASGKITALPVITPDGRRIDITPNEQNEVSNAISLFLKQEGIAN